MKSVRARANEDFATLFLLRAGKFVLKECRSIAPLQTTQKLSNSIHEEASS
jgi:hypothetical protein